MPQPIVQIYHWTEYDYITSCYFSELIMSDAMYLFTSIMVCELLDRRCNSGLCMTGYLPSVWNIKSTLHQSL